MLVKASPCSLPCPPSSPSPPVSRLLAVPVYTGFAQLICTCWHHLCFSCGLIESCWACLPLRWAAEWRQATLLLQPRLSRKVNLGSPKTKAWFPAPPSSLPTQLLNLVNQTQPEVLVTLSPHLTAAGLDPRLTEEALFSCPVTPEHRCPGSQETGLSACFLLCPHTAWT